MVELFDIVVLIVANGIVDTLFVAWVAGWRSKKALVGYLNSPESERLWAKQADRIHRDLDPELKAIGGLEARLTAQIPADPRGDILAIRDELKTEIGGINTRLHEALEQLDAQLSGILEGLPEKIHMAYLSEKGVQERLLRQQLDGAAGDLEKIAEDNLDKYIVQGDPMAKEIMDWVRKPVDPAYEERSPIGAGLLRLLKGAAAKEVAPMLQGNGTTPGRRRSNDRAAGVVSPYGA